MHLLSQLLLCWNSCHRYIRSCCWCSRFSCCLCVRCSCCSTAFVSLAGDKTSASFVFVRLSTSLVASVEVTIDFVVSNWLSYYAYLEFHRETEDIVTEQSSYDSSKVLQRQHRYDPLLLNFMKLIVYLIFQYNFPRDFICQNQTEIYPISNNYIISFSNYFSNYCFYKLYVTLNSLTLRKFCNIFHRLSILISYHLISKTIFYKNTKTLDTMAFTTILTQIDICQIFL